MRGLVLGYVLSVVMNERETPGRMDFARARRTMVDCQVRPSDVTDYAIIEAMLEVPRERFVPEGRRDLAYADEHVVFPNGEVMVAPRVFAKMLQVAGIGEGDFVLDIGCATGYSSAVISRLASGVVALGSDAAQVEQASETLADIGAVNCAVLHCALGEGEPAHQPYDVILVGGGVEEIPQSIPDQLRSGGRMVSVRLSGSTGECRVLIRSGDSFTDRWAFDATAPLLSEFVRARQFAF